SVSSEVSTSCSILNS
ncbi:hypothetical protein Zm00014a_021964, partial [Zea mays]